VSLCGCAALGTFDDGMTDLSSRRAPMGAVLRSNRGKRTIGLVAVLTYSRNHSASCCEYFKIIACGR
jgi:hypothetical protein